MKILLGEINRGKVPLTLGNRERGGEMY